MDTFYSSVNKAIEIGTVRKNISSKEIRAKTKSPWINKFILDKIKKRNRLYRITLNRPYDMRFKSYYERFSLNLRRLIDNTKHEYYNRLLTKYNGNSAEQWKIINNITGCKKKTDIERLTLNDGSTIEEPQTICDTINKYLVDVHEQLIVGGTGGAAAAAAAAAAATARCTSELRDTGNRLNTPQRSFFVTPVDREELKDIIRNLKNKRSCGFDNVTVALVKRCTDIFAYLLEHIINCSFRTGVFPKSLKKSIVIPIPKKSNSIKIDNLRPISLLSVFSKIFEKVMKARLLSYLNNSNFFSENQYGFLEGKSTEQALSAFVETVYSKLNEGNKCTAVFVDFRKAFDLVDHECLLTKMENIGVRGNALNWFRQFLTDREQIVKCRGCLSKSEIIKKGVPQGSVLSATLFLIFINDLLEVQIEGRVTAFADDVAFLFWNKDRQKLCNSINKTLSFLNIWCMENKMCVNVSKTKVLNFKMNRHFFEEDNFKYHSLTCCRTPNCNCQTIENVGSFKYLGVIIDRELSWKVHIEELTKGLKGSIRKFYFLRNVCDQNLLRILYFALINSKLQYGIHCWGGTFKNFITKIRTVQNHYIRIILYKNRRESSFQLFKQLNILPLQNLYIFKVLQIFFIRSGNNETNLIRHNHDTRSRSANLIRKPKISKSLMTRSFIFLGAKIFNDMPTDLKLSRSMSKYKNKVKQWLFNFEDTSQLIQVLR
jgi:hypothetical protein